MKIAFVLYISLFLQNSLSLSLSCYFLLLILLILFQVRLKKTFVFLLLLDYAIGKLNKSLNQFSFLFGTIFYAAALLIKSFRASVRNSPGEIRVVKCCPLIN